MPNKKYKIEVLTPNFGYALQANTLQVTFQTVITSIDITTGSVAGGTKVTIAGAGFYPYSYVQFDQIPNVYFYTNDGQNTQVTFNSIVFITPAQLDGTFTIQVFSGGVLSLCNGSCNFTFSDSITPVIDSIDKTNINDTDSITLTGANFGSVIENTNVTIGSQLCAIQSVNDTEIICQLDGLNLGSQSINVNIIGVGNAANPNSLTVTGSTSIISISPSSGSVNGGTLVTILGNGFDNTTNVLIGNSNCKLSTVTINQLTCVTSAHTAASNLNFQISTNNVAYTTNGNTYSYDVASSAVIDSISPANGVDGILTINGSKFGTDSTAVSVSIGKSSCVVTSVD